jgi:hypothetical protein
MPGKFKRAVMNLTQSLSLLELQSQFNEPAPRRTQ